ncbi:MAG: hypothetical protein M1812_002737 [Candelaria pacifica]|nr:MAG: hypothetical protein M1812_002737 [Candelaria pacifica]
MPQIRQKVIICVQYHSLTLHHSQVARRDNFVAAAKWDFKLDHRKTGRSTWSPEHRVYWRSLWGRKVVITSREVVGRKGSSEKGLTLPVLNAPDKRHKNTAFRGLCFGRNVVESFFEDHSKAVAIAHEDCFTTVTDNLHPPITAKAHCEPVAVDKLESSSEDCSTIAAHESFLEACNATAANTYTLPAPVRGGQDLDLGAPDASDQDTSSDKGLLDVEEHYDEKPSSLETMKTCNHQALHHRRLQKPWQCQEADGVRAENTERALAELGSQVADYNKLLAAQVHRVELANRVLASVCILLKAFPSDEGSLSLEAGEKPSIRRLDLREPAGMPDVDFMQQRLQHLKDSKAS